MKKYVFERMDDISEQLNYLESIQAITDYDYCTLLAYLDDISEQLDYLEYIRSIQVMTKPKKLQCEIKSIKEALEE